MEKADLGVAFENSHKSKSCDGRLGCGSQSRMCAASLAPPKGSFAPDHRIHDFKKFVQFAWVSLRISRKIETFYIGRIARKPIRDIYSLAW